MQGKPHAHSYSNADSNINADLLHANAERNPESYSHAKVSPESKGAAYSTASPNTGPASTFTATYPSPATHAAASPDTGAAPSFPATHSSAAAHSLGPA